MAFPKTVHILFGTVLVLFVFTLISHISSPTQDGADEVYESTTGSGFGSKVADHLKPYFGGTGSLGNIRTHVARSEDNYQRMLKQRVALLKDYEDPADKPLFPCNSSVNYWKMPFSIWDFVPASFNCPHSIMRVGRLGDGGKWLCGLERHVSLPKTRTLDASASIIASGATVEVGHSMNHGRQPGCVIYSFGIQEESSFEEELLQSTPSCEIWGYDFSEEKFGPQLHEVEGAGRAHFTKAGIAGTTDVARVPPFYSIQDLMAMNGHDHIDVLKMDIEGDEFESMSSMINFFLNNGMEIPISQFLVEIHLYPFEIDTDAFLAWWELLEAAGFRPVWTEPNLLVTTIPLHDGMPRYAEYTFINIKDRRSPLLK